MPIHHLTQIRNKATKEFCGRSLPRADLPQEEAEAFFRTCCEEWEASEPCKQFRAILDAAKIPVGIAKIVAFACGTFSYISQKPVHSRGISRAATQHALILTVRDVLGKKQDGGSGEIVCYAQDPVYSELDKEILQQSGIQILDDPAGFLEVDESAVVLSFCPNVCVRQVVCDIARPAMMIWDSVILDEDQMEEGQRRWVRSFCVVQFRPTNTLEMMLIISRTDPESPRVKKMVQDDYDEFKMPDYEIDHFGAKFGVAGIYVRKGGVTSRL
jgi:hypothetical protein